MYKPTFIYGVSSGKFSPGNRTTGNREKRKEKKEGKGKNNQTGQKALALCDGHEFIQHHKVLDPVVLVLL